MSSGSPVGNLLRFHASCFILHPFRRGSSVGHRTVRVAAFLAVFAVASRGSHIVRPHHIELHASPEQTAKLTGFARRCSEASNALFGVKTSPAETLFVHVKTAPVSSSDPLVLTLSEDTSLIEVTHAMARALVYRHTLGTTQPDSGGAVKDIDWLAAVLVSQTLLSRHLGLAQMAPDLRPVRAVFAQGHFPDVRRLLEAPVDPGHELAYSLYALHCHVLAAAIRSATGHRGKGLAEVLRLQAGGSSAVEAVTAVVKPSFEQGLDLQRWYEESAEKATRSHDERMRADEVATRLHTLETVPVITPGRLASGCSRIPVDEVPSHMASGALNSETARHLELQVRALIDQAPEALQEPLVEYVKAFQSLAKGKNRAFKRAIRSGRQQFTAALEHERAVSTYLDTVEKQTTSLDDRFALYLRVTRRHRDLRRKLAPELDAYLDAVEP